MPRPKFLLAYALVLHLVLLLLVLRIAQPQLGIWGPAGSLSQAEIHYRNMVDYHQRSDAALPPGRVLFLGDSLTQGLPVTAVTEHGVNYGIGSDDSVGLLRRLDNYDSLNSARGAVVAMGSNDLNRADNDEFLDNYRAVLNALPEDVPVLCSAILPIDEPVRSNWLRRSNERIQRVNELLRTTCEQRGHVFVDATSTLADDAGNLDAAYHIGDGLHLNATGNALWIAELQTALRELGIAD